MATRKRGSKSDPPASPKRRATDVAVPDISP
jgi:hypothetical protein